jgi:hypothetical protein
VKRPKWLWGSRLTAGPGLYGPLTSPSIRVGKADAKLVVGFRFKVENAPSEEDAPHGGLLRRAQSVPVRPKKWQGRAPGAFACFPVLKAKLRVPVVVTLHHHLHPQAVNGGRIYTGNTRKGSVSCEARNERNQQEKRCARRQSDLRHDVASLQIWEG